MGKKNSILPILVILLLACSFLAGEAISQAYPGKRLKALSRDSFTRSTSYGTISSGSSGRAGNPPPGPIHSCAEWEESEGIILDNYWKNADTVYKMQLDQQIYIQCNNQTQVDVWETFLNNNGIPLTNIHFLMIPCNVGSMRDCAPLFIWDGNNEMGIVNNTCWQGSLPLDDLVPRQFARMFNIKYYEPRLKIYCEGGNFYPNGYGVCFSSSWVYADNKKKSKAITDSLFNKYLGVEHYHTPAPNTIWHHDTWGKPANPETMIVVQWPKWHKYYPVGEGMAAYYETLQSPWGGPYEIHRLPMFKKGNTFKPYMNSLTSNTKVYVPVDQSPDDAIALAVFEAAFPGYDIVGVDSHGTQWEGSLHCATKNIMRRDPLRIYTVPPRDTEDTTSVYPVTAEVIPPNGFNLLAGYPVIHWTDTGGAPFYDVVMNPTGQPNEYCADIPAQAWDTTVSFYVEARDDGGREALYPMVAPEGMMSFTVREDTEAPVLSRFVPTRSSSAGAWPPLVRTLCKDDMATPELLVKYAVNGVPQTDVSLSREEMCFWYSGKMGGSVSAGDLVTYSVKATDNALAANSSVLPKVGEIYCPVAAPGEAVGIVNLGSRPYTGPFLVDALGGLDIPHHYYEEWPADFDEHEVWFICLGVFAYNHVLSVDEANDIVAVLQAGKKVYLEGGDTWCYDPMKDTLKPWFGVDEISRGGGLDCVYGVSGSVAEEIVLDYAEESEDICLNRMSAVSPAKKLLEDSNRKALAVQHDGGGYRTIASSVPLGGLNDGEWPDLRKEILVRYLEFFDVASVELMAAADASQCDDVPVFLEGEPGHEYVLFASLSENYMPTGYGVFRLGFDFLFNVSQGVIPVSGVEELLLSIPHNDDIVGIEIHLQAVTGEKILPSMAQLTNREIVTVVE